MRLIHARMDRRSRTALGALLMGLGLLAFGAPTPAPAAPAGKVTICHATGSVKNPYVRITISVDARAAHDAHLDGLDLIPAPDKCPGPAVPPPTTTTTVQPPTTTTTVLEPPFLLCVVSAGVTQTATTVTGTPGDDTVDCTNASPGKTIDTFAGNDTITGTNFVDVITSGDGNDTVTGLDGNDVIAAGDGNNTVTGGLGDDTITAGSGNDSLTGSEGNDFLDGGTGIDTLSGGMDDDQLVGPNNDGSQDTVSGGDGIDACTGPGLDGDIVTGCEVITP